MGIPWGGGSTQRFWYTYFAGARATTCERLQQTVAPILDGSNPLDR